jgi:putative endopeptidase
LSLFRVLVRVCGALALVAVLATSLQHAGAVKAATSAAAEFPKPGIDLANLDVTCKPCDDFWQFATGGWQKHNPIPAGYASWGSFSILAQDNQNVLHDILDSAAQDKVATLGSPVGKVGAYYRSCMNETAIEAAGLTPLKPEFERIAAITNKDSLMSEIARFQRLGLGTPLNIASQPDSKNSAIQIADVGFGGLGLPDRDFYFREDDKSKTVRTQYTAYVAQMLGLAGDSAAGTAAEADAIVALETAIAKATPTRAALRNPDLTEHPTTFANLSTMAPDINWTAYATALGTPPITGKINVDLPDFVTTASGLIVQTPMDTWKAYLRYHLLDGYAATLPKNVVDANFAFRSTALFGVKDQLPRWKRCAAATDRALGDDLGQVYVSKVFPPVAKARIVALVNNLQGVLQDDITTLSWMTPPTKTRAHAKLAALLKKVGYPNKWRDYSKLDIANVPYATNAMHSRTFNVLDNLHRIGKPTDRTEWGITMATVNAYYNPTNNEVVFPAGILAPPFFSAKNDDAVNYGAAGAVIGHEMTHGFDDQGRRYDAKGNLTDWWQPADTKDFNARAQCIIDQFDGYVVSGDVHIQGKLVTGEAIADLGGLTIAYKAFERTAQAKAHKKIQGYTPEQRFFMAYANVWANNERDEAARQQALTNEHPDNKYRLIGTLSNMPEFRKAFACAATDKMVRANACQIW